MTSFRTAIFIAAALTISSPVYATDVTVGGQAVPLGENAWGDVTVGNWTLAHPLSVTPDAPDTALYYGPHPSFMVACYSGGSGRYSLETMPTTQEVPDGPGTVNIVVNGHRRALAGHGEYGMSLSATLSKQDMAWLIASYGGADTVEAFALAAKDCGRP